MKKINSLFFLFWTFFLNAQIISGTVLSKDENQPIPYVKIGVEKENIGVISDEKGNFSIDLTKANRAGNVRIEVAGYENYTETVQNFVKNNSQKILLKEKVKNIQEVKLTPKKLVDKNWGVTTKTKNVMYSVNPGLNQENFLGETALQFNATRRSKIKNINLNIASYVSDEPVQMRYTIYSEKNGFPDKNILNEEINVALTEDMTKSGTFALDVNDYNIWVQGKFFIGIQFLKRFNGRIKISAALFRTGFLREFYGDWQKVTLAAPAINIDVKVDKNGKNMKDESEVSDESLADLIPDLSPYKIASENSIYGKNTSAGKFLKGNHADLYYETYGEGEPLVLLHGNSGSIKDFYQQIPVLSQHYKVIALDTRGQGKSTDTSKNDLTYSIFADDVKKLIDELGIKKINIVGWSDGGNTGLEFVLKYPENVNKLITIGANSKPDGVDVRLFNSMKTELQVLELENKPEKFNQTRILKIMIKEPNISKSSLRKIQKPVLVIAGENDVIKKEETEFIAKQIPNAKLKIYKKATHFIPFENPDQLNNDILEFFK
ncbi:alpha/beta fold hydrolase [Chryseobacterium paridis]|uniref:Alpha/beta fold hydrolase n=1 Tax=Chryseobacterium paridis TaxID=2800328 RepID=A0ABS1FZS6_9FLAO|nr:alpha/beta fold hydrolase [Chryseobacterium paridis]MBK1897946.1 alpha/beta fold hydrolase [Chryseobacterium paridis]